MTERREKYLRFAYPILGVFWLWFGWSAEQDGGGAVRELAGGHAVRVDVLLRPDDGPPDGAADSVVQPAAGGEVRTDGGAACGAGPGHESGRSGCGAGVAERGPGARVLGYRLARRSGVGVRGHGRRRRRRGFGFGRLLGGGDPGCSGPQALVRSWTRARSPRCARRERGGAAVGRERAVGNGGGRRSRAGGPLVPTDLGCTNRNC